MKVKRFTFGPFETNCYVVSDEQQVLLIDPACYTEYERDMLKAYISNFKSQISNFKLSIIATHGHLDHLWGAKWATEQWGVPVLMHEADIPMVKAMQQQYELFGVRRQAEEFMIERIQNTGVANASLQGTGPLPTYFEAPLPQNMPLQRTFCEGGEQLSIINCQLSIIHTPGHTPGSICLYWPQEKVLLSGDTLFQMGYGRTDLPGGNFGQLIDSLERLFTLPVDTMVYPGHGDFTTIGAEKR